MNEVGEPLDLVCLCDDMKRNMIAGIVGSVIFYSWRRPEAELIKKIVPELKLINEQ